MPGKQLFPCSLFAAFMFLCLACAADAVDVVEINATDEISSIWWDLWWDLCDLTDENACVDEVDEGEPIMPETRGQRVSQFTASTCPSGNFQVADVSGDDGDGEVICDFPECEDMCVIVDAPNRCSFEFEVTGEVSVCLPGAQFVTDVWWWAADTCDMCVIVAVAPSDVVLPADCVRLIGLRCELCPPELGTLLPDPSDISVPSAELPSILDRTINDKMIGRWTKFEICPPPKVCCDCDALCCEIDCMLCVDCDW